MCKYSYKLYTQQSYRYDLSNSNQPLVCKCLYNTHIIFFQCWILPMYHVESRFYPIFCQTDYYFPSVLIVSFTTWLPLHRIGHFCPSCFSVENEICPAFHLADLLYDQTLFLYIRKLHDFHMWTDRSEFALQSSYTQHIKH